MPDYSLNELVFSDLSDEAIAQTEALTVNAQENVDFNILLPLPENLRGEWGPGDTNRVVSIWGTKWNAHAKESFKMVQKPSRGTLILRFVTASPGPYLWVEALIKACQVPVEYRMCNEKEYSFTTTLGRDSGNCFDWKRIDERSLLNKHLCEVFTQAAGY
jgi:hypothetical protein